jgi:aminoglycoside phosphotransferase (APT) family kinase protein
VKTTNFRLLGDISEEQFQAALDCFNLGKFIKAEGIPAGLFGQNVFLTSTEGEFVLRGVPHYNWQFPTEQFFAKFLVTRAGLKAPWPYLIEFDPSIFGWSFAIMPRLAGDNVSEPHLRARLIPSEKIEVAQALGRNLAQMHSPKWDSTGKYDYTSGTIKPFEPGYTEWVLAELRQNFALARSYSEATTAADEAWLEDIVSRNGWALEVPFEPTYVHHDYREANLVMTKTALGWEVSGVFDLMEGYIGDGDADLVRQVSNWHEHGDDRQLGREFVKTYQAARPPREGFRERAQLYMLCDLSLIWEFFHRPGKAMHDRPDSFQGWATSYVQLFEGF